MKDDQNQHERLVSSLAGFFDANWYREQYPDIATANVDPLDHFIRHGLAEQRDPNAFFDSSWYLEHYVDVRESGLLPLLHYMQAGAGELRCPHPNFDAVWYASENPNAAANPLVYHIKIGLSLGCLTQKPIDVAQYLPSHRPAPKLPPRVAVDVVIPVYSGLDDTRRCITSVLADRSRPRGRIIVVDDRSPEPLLSAWLRDLAARSLIELIRHKRNLGFCASVNQGMIAAGTNDVVLLNSDTEVPPGWLLRLTAQAYAQPRIATVSPFSNNATICGYPDNEGGSIAFGHTPAEVDDVCSTVNAGRWLDVPTTVGFCMYIRREALQEVGGFDAERFGTGYGEENDFCLRATALGWQHRLGCDTFVYHRGSVSFGDRANTLSAKALKLLLERYPYYREMVSRHVALAEVAPLRFAVTAGLLRQSDLPVILMVTHNLGGGIRRHIDSLVDRYRDNARVLLLLATERGASLSVPALPNHPALTLPADRLDDLVLVLRSMHLSRVHLHHTLAMDIDVQALIRRLNVPFDVTVHDYYAICPQINLLPRRHSLYCGEPLIAGCNACIAQRPSHGARDIITWRAAHDWQFKDAARVFCPSIDVLSRLQRFGLAANAVVAPHEAVEAAPWKVDVVSPGGGKLRIAVLGTLVDHKGGRTVASVAEMIDPSTTQIQLIGHTDGVFSRQAIERMQITGRYEDADLAHLIQTSAPHLIWFPAAWPETFSYTVSAAINARIPIAATRIGAHTERLAGRPFTWLLDVATSPLAWVTVFDQIRGALKTGENTAVADKPRPLAVTTRLEPSMRAPVPDFYATNYLHPGTAKPSVRHTQSHIAVVPERFEAGFATPCAYIRLIQPLTHPAIVSGFDVRITTADAILEHEADVIITQRSAIPDLDLVKNLAAHARRTGATLVFDLDDDLLTIPRTHPDAEFLQPRSKAVRHMLEVADVVWLASRGLAERLVSVRPDALVVENRLDERIWVQPAAASSHQPLRVICMGTASHERDFAMIEPALLRLKAEYGARIEIDVVGMTKRHELPAGLNRLGPPPNATRSYPGFVNWLAGMQPGWHVGLAPLLDTPFNLCKSPLKAMDYAALGMIVLASDTPVYRGSIADGPAGQLVANSPAAWYAALNSLLRDRDKRRSVAAHSRDAFLARGSLASQGARRYGMSSDLLQRKTNAAA